MSNLNSYLTEGWQARLAERAAHYEKADGVDTQRAFSMALFYEALRSVAHIEKAQQDLLADIEVRLTNLEARVRKLEAHG